MVHDDQRWQLPFFAKDANVGVRLARRDPPVDIAGVIAGLVLAHLVEIDAASLAAGFVHAHAPALGATGKGRSAQVTQRKEFLEARICTL